MKWIQAENLMQDNTKNGNKNGEKASIKGYVVARLESTKSLYQKVELCSNKQTKIMKQLDLHSLLQFLDALYCPEPVTDHSQDQQYLYWIIRLE